MELHAWQVQRGLAIAEQSRLRHYCIVAGQQEQCCCSAERSELEWPGKAVWLDQGLAAAFEGQDQASLHNQGACQQFSSLYCIQLWLISTTC
jgi:hypothetical protein